jgi:hypothetical protein
VTNKNTKLIVSLVDSLTPASRISIYTECYLVGITRCSVSQKYQHPESSRSLRSHFSLGSWQHIASHPFPISQTVPVPLEVCPVISSYAIMSTGLDELKVTLPVYVIPSVAGLLQIFFCPLAVCCTEVWVCSSCCALYLL